MRTEPHGPRFRIKRPDTIRLTVAWWLLALPACAALLPHSPLVPTESELARLARVRSLLASSTAERPNPVHIVFYGQSITLQPWWVQVSDELRRLYPTALLNVENKAISGFQDWALTKTAVADLIPMQPDLVIFHAYGSGVGTDSLLAELRSMTTAEMLVQSDHISGYPGQLDEETDPQRIALPDSGGAYRNYVTLPAAADRHGACLAHIRDAWKDYLRSNGVPPESLLADGNVHLNDDGDALMAEFVLAYLRPANVAVTDDPWDGPQVRSAYVGRDAFWRQGVLECRFTGSTLTAVLKGPLPATVEVWVDGRRPSTLPELYGVSRVSPTHFAGWPALSRVAWEQPLVEEDWTLTPHDFSANGQNFAFSVRGSLTGPDGEGTSLARFVSDSGRVVIEPDDHWLGRAVYWSGNKPVPAGYEAHWRVERHFFDELPAGLNPPVSTGRVVRLVQGLSDGPHRLWLVAKDGAGGSVEAIRAFSPSGSAAIVDSGIDPPGPLPELTGLETPEGRSLAWSRQLIGWRLETSAAFGPDAVWTPVPETDFREWTGWRTLPLSPFPSPSFFRLTLETNGMTTDRR